MPESPAPPLAALLHDMETRGVRTDPRLDPLIYEEMRVIAERLMRREAHAHTLQPTAVAHEAWMRFAQATSLGHPSRIVFLGLAARAMRRVLVDHARSRKRQKRGEGWERVTLSDVGTDGSSRALDLLDLDDALGELHQLGARRVAFVEMRLFAGMSNAEVAEALDVAESTARADWLTARAWLAARQIA